MSRGNTRASLSTIDEERFGVRTAKAFIAETGEIDAVMEFCKANKVEFLISRCPTSELKSVQEMEGLGFSLMDTLIYYSCDLRKSKIPLDVSIRQVMSGEEGDVRAIAKESFRGYLGHYHADSRLEKDKCDEVYTDWAYKSCLSRDVAEAVLLAEYGDKIIGFATMRINEGREGEGVLFGVAPSFQGRGVYRQLMTSGMRWCIERGLGTMVVSTQITNTAVQKVWTRLGFEPVRSYYTFHKWFESASDSNSHAYENL